MADENLPTEERVRRSVGRSFRRGVLFVVLLAGLMGWGSNSTGFRASTWADSIAASAIALDKTGFVSSEHPRGLARAS